MVPLPGEGKRPTPIWLTPSRASIILAGTAPNQVLELEAQPYFWVPVPAKLTIGTAAPD
jgi:hypothetical protein